MHEQHIFGSNQYGWFMGRVKAMMMDYMDDPYYGIPDKKAAVNLFGNKLVSEYASKHSFDGVCDYCGETTRVVHLRTIVEEIDRIILRYFGEPDNEAVGWDSGFEDDTPGFHTEGGGYIVPNDKYYTNDMKELLFKYHFNVENDGLKEDISDALGYHYCLIEKDSYGLNPAEERWVDWRKIKECAMKMAKDGKSLSEMVKAESARLAYLLGDIHTAHLPLQIKRELILYRNVNYKSKRLPLLFRDLTSPPVKYTCNLRMSQKGDSVFYGAEAKETAIKEALNDEGKDYAYVGKFQTKHPLRLLDLTGIPEQLTIFDHEQYHLLVFLREFCKAISEYVPEHDPVLYAPTQLITHYLRNKLCHYDDPNNHYPIDGILYNSSKDRMMNAVLFYDHENSRKHLKLLNWEVFHNGKVAKHCYITLPYKIECILAQIRKIWMKQ